MQSRDEIAEEIVALAGSVSNEKAARMRELVSEARKAGPLKSTAGSDGAPQGQSPGGELPVERRATSGPVVPLEERGRVDEPFEPWARRQIEKLAAILLPLESSMSKMRERVYEIVREEIALVRGGEDPHAAQSPSPSLVEAADALARAARTIHEEDAADKVKPRARESVMYEALARYESARARHAEGAKQEHVPVAQPEERARPKGEVAGSTPAGDTYLNLGLVSEFKPHARVSGAPAKWRVEVVHGRARVIVDASGDSGEQSFWINDADTDDEPGHAEFHARMLRIAIGRILGAPAPAPLGTLPAFHTLEECREVFRRVTKRGPCLSSEDLHGIAAIRDFLTLTPEQFRENWGQQEDAPASAQGDESAWLIERPGPLWWSGREGCGAWTTATDALRFARWEDADRMRRVMGFDDAKATEHIWCAPPSSEKTGEAHK